MSDVFCSSSITAFVNSTSYRPENNYRGMNFLQLFGLLYFFICAMYWCCSDWEQAKHSINRVLGLRMLKRMWNAHCFTFVDIFYLPWASFDIGRLDANASVSLRFWN